MYTGLKQKVMTRAFLEARARDDEEWQLYSADAAAAAVEEERARRTRVPRGFLDTLGWGPGRDSGLHGGGVSSYGNGRAARPSPPGSDGEGDGEGPGGVGQLQRMEPRPEPGNYGIAAGMKRKRETSSFSFPNNLGASAPLARPPRLERPRNRHVSAFRSRYWYYAEWMCAWHCGFVDADHVALRMGTADDVLAWGRRAVTGRGAQSGDHNRCPATVLVAVVRLRDGAVVHVGDLRGEGGGLLGVESGPASAGEAGEGKRGGGGGGGPSEWAFFGEEPPPAEGTEWARLAPCTASAPRLPAMCAVGVRRARALRALRADRRRARGSSGRRPRHPSVTGARPRTSTRGSSTLTGGRSPPTSARGGVGAEPSVFRAARRGGEGTREGPRPGRRRSTGRGRGRFKKSNESRGGDWSGREG